MVDPVGPVCPVGPLAHRFAAFASFVYLPRSPQSLKGVSGDVIILEEAAYCDPVRNGPNRNCGLLYQLLTLAGTRLRGGRSVAEHAIERSPLHFYNSWREDSTTCASRSVQPTRQNTPNLSTGLKGETTADTHNYSAQHWA